MTNVLLVFILAHLIGDFITQTSNINSNKRYFTRLFYSKGLLYHVIHHVILSAVLLYIFTEWKNVYLVIIAIIVFFHYMIDFLKIKIEDSVIPRLKSRREEKKYWLHFIFEKKTTYFLIDQGLHLVSIYVVLVFLNIAPPLNGIFSDVQVLDGKGTFIVSAILFVMLTFVSAHFIASLMADLWQPEAENEIAATLADDDEQINQVKDKIAQSNKDLVINETYKRDNENYRLELQYQAYANSPEGPRGKYIGILERILICIFILYNVYQGFALLIA